MAFNFVVPEFLKQVYFNNTLYDYLLFFFIIGAGVIVAKIFYWVVQKFIKVLTQKTETRLDDLLVDMLEEPVVVFIVLISIKIAWTFLTFTVDSGSWTDKIPIWFDNLMYTAFALNITWMITRTLDAMIEEYIKPIADKSDNDLDDTLLPIMQTVISVVAFAVAIIMILSHFGQEIGPMLAGLGIGGLAFAFAAKDIIANIFGSITVITDKPFKVGDRIAISGSDGFVREINLRRTRIEKLDGRMIYIPNSLFTTDILENATQEWARKISMKIGLVYSTDIKGMKKAKEIINKVIDTLEGIDKSKRVVAFTDFGDFSKQISVVYWITDKDKIFEIQDEFNMKLMEGLEKAKLSMAFPTQTIEIKK